MTHNPLTDPTPDDLTVIEREHYGRRFIQKRHDHPCKQSLCHQCARFKPNTPDNCVIAQEVFDNCVRLKVMSPIIECAEYQYPEEP